MNGLGALPLLAWPAIAGAAALFGGAWWLREDIADAAGGVGPTAKINIRNPPVPPAPEAAADLYGGWTPENMWAGYENAWNQYRIQASEDVVLRPPAEDSDGAPLWLMIGVGALGMALLVRRY